MIKTDIFGAQIIDRFHNENRFLSNFYPAKLTLWGVDFPTSEHAYQWAKTLDHNEKETILRIKIDGPNGVELRPTSAFEAKQAGAKVTKRTDWEIVRFDIMHEVLLAKFSQNQHLKGLLIDTGNALLIEGNHWHDNIWGICFCGKKKECDSSGTNLLGKALMLVRDNIG